MSNENNRDAGDAGKAHRFLGSLKDALMAAGRNEQPTPDPAVIAASAKPEPVRVDKALAVDAETIVMPAKVAEPARAAKSAEPFPESMTRAIRGSDPRRPAPAPRTQLLRGRVEVTRAEFHQDPVVGWLVIVGGNGLGAFRPIFEGNNTVGRARTQRIAIDFGDETISSEEQAYIRYDATDRSFLFVPNLSKTNVVSINNKKPTAAVSLQAMDVITMGRTQLAFVPFCGADFDWSELVDAKD
jgi:FHA domain-containing protein